MSHPVPPTHFEWDVCLSYASEQREYVSEVYSLLRSAGIQVFYDKAELPRLWGKDLVDHLTDIYEKKSRFCVLFASADYAEKVWTSLERRNAQARALAEKEPYLLPARFDDTAIPGLPATVAYIDLRVTTPAELAGLVVEKLKEREGHAVTDEGRETAVTAPLGTGGSRKAPQGRVAVGVLAILAVLSAGMVAFNQRESWFASSPTSNSDKGPQPASGLPSPGSPSVLGTGDAGSSADAGTPTADSAYRNAIRIPGGDRAQVQSCAYFTGTFGAAAGNTLILVKRNKTTGDGPYVEYVFRWNDAARPQNWYGAQYFGEDNGGAGQWFEIELRQVPLSAAQAAKDDASAANALARTGSRVAAVSVKRVSGHAPDECPGPP